MSDAHDPDLDGDAPDEEVGYRRPPKATRFAKGRSGNPSGRRKGAPSRLATLNAYEEHLRRPVSATVDGVKRRISLREALELKIVEQSATLPPMALLKLLRELDVEILRNREAQAKRAMSRANKLVQQCFDCAEIVDGLVALGLIRLDDGCRRLVPEKLFKMVPEKTFSTDSRPQVEHLRLHYWPGTQPSRPKDNDDPDGV